MLLNELVVLAPFAGLDPVGRVPLDIDSDLSPGLARWKKGKSCHVLEF